MRTLGIESSCDDTAVAIVEAGRTVCHLWRFTQKVHSRYGGIVPEVASRLHVSVIHQGLTTVFDQCRLRLSDIDRIAVTRGPGLEGALLVGVTVAKTLSQFSGIPVIGINHLHGHFYAAGIDNPLPDFPFIAMIISGGHTVLAIVHDHGNVELLGGTRDDAIGETFDKVARALGLPYPGGPEIEKQSQLGDPKRFRFPKSLMKSGYEMSFSGLKTAVMQKIAQFSPDSLPVADICAGFSRTIIETVVGKLQYAVHETGINRVVVAGGVVANRELTEAIGTNARKTGYTVHLPKPEFCTDNAAMIAVAGHFAKSPTHPFSVDANLRIGTA